MAIDLCIEGAGWVVYAIDGGVSDLLSTIRSFVTNSSPRDGSSSEVSNTATGTLSTPVHVAAAELPLEQATAIWFVDVCGYSYAEAGTAIGVSRETIEHWIREGRQSIRLRVYGAPPRCN